MRQIGWTKDTVWLWHQNWVIYSYSNLRKGRTFLITILAPDVTRCSFLIESSLSFALLAGFVSREWAITSSSSQQRPREHMAQVSCNYPLSHLIHRLWQQSSSYYPLLITSSVLLSKIKWRVQGTRSESWSSTMSSLSSSWDETGITNWGYDTNIA